MIRPQLRSESGEVAFLAHPSLTVDGQVIDDNSLGGHFQLSGALPAEAWEMQDLEDFFGPDALLL